MATEINELFRKYKESGDIAIRNQIVEKYLYIADILAKKFVGRGVEYDDLKQVASYALLRGVDRFDPKELSHGAPGLFLPGHDGGAGKVRTLLELGQHAFGDGTGTDGSEFHSRSSSYNKFQINIFRYQQVLRCP